MCQLAHSEAARLRISFTKNCGAGTMAPSVLTKFKSGKRPLRVGTFFSGLGGWELAIRRAASTTDNRLKCHFVFAVDKDKHCKTVLETVVCPDKVHHGLVEELDVRNLPDVDVLAFSPSCCGFSAAGKNEGFNHTEGSIVKAPIEYLSSHPSVMAFFMEQVDMKSRHCKARNQILKCLRALQRSRYVISHKVLSADSFGIPQKRKRWFVVGIARDLQLASFAMPTGFGSCLSLRHVLDLGDTGGEEDMPRETDNTGTKNLILALQKAMTAGINPLKQCCIFDLYSSKPAVHFDSFPTITSSRACSRVSEAKDQSGWFISNLLRFARWRELCLLQGLPPNTVQKGELHDSSLSRATLSRTSELLN